MFIPDPGPDFYPSRIPDPKTAMKETLREGEKKLFSYLFCSHKYHKIENYFIFELGNKIFLANLQRIIQ